MQTLSPSKRECMLPPAERRAGEEECDGCEISAVRSVFAKESFVAHAKQSMRSRYVTTPTNQNNQ